MQNFVKHIFTILKRMPLVPRNKNETWATCKEQESKQINYKWTMKEETTALMMSKNKYRKCKEETNNKN